jgi:hypothetical protein
MLRWLCTTKKCSACCALLKDAALFMYVPKIRNHTCWLVDCLERKHGQHHEKMQLPLQMKAHEDGSCVDPALRPSVVAFQSKKCGVGQLCSTLFSDRAREDGLCVI